MWAFILLWVLVAIAFVIGWRTRVAGAVLGCLIGYSLLLDQQLYSNHLYLLFLIVVLLTISAAAAAGTTQVDCASSKPLPMRIG